MWIFKQLRWEKSITKLIQYSIVIFIVILLAEVLLSFFPNSIFPKPSQVLSSLVDLVISGELMKHLIVSIFRVSIGFLISAFLGITSGIFLAYYKNIDYFLHPIIEILRPIPPIAWIPIAILLFGIGNNSSFFIVFLGAFFPIFLNSYQGALSLPKIYKNVSQTFEINNKVYLTRILFYYSLPYIFTGLKVGIGMAWMSVVAAEMIGAQSGLGYFIQLNRLLLRSDNIVLGMIMIGLVGSILSFVISFVEKRIVLWKK